ncbi:MAG TPA: hypothetical protein VGE02_04140 [Gemmatimonadales bacterium]
MDVVVLTWEDIVGVIAAKDSAAGGELGEFLCRCLEYNRPASLGRSFLSQGTSLPTA